jgi:L-lysine 6-transaminase
MGVIERLKKHILVDGFHVVVDLKKSHGSWVVDKETGKEYLDCYSQFASQALGWNHPGLLAHEDKIRDVALYKIANSDMYTEEYADFVEEFAFITPDFKHHFFIDGGALGVENALKAAFDWKAQSNCECAACPERMEILYLEDAFHGRTGYTMSLTNTDPVKTMHYPKFNNWVKIGNPTISKKNEIWGSVWGSPWGSVRQTIEDKERATLMAAIERLRLGKVAAIIMEPIQGEGGDNHYRPEFVQQLRQLADLYNVLLIFDEVQTGMGLTGAWWAYQHHGVKPDLMCFGKKTQVCGFCSTDKIDTVSDNVFRKSSRINSTWGGNLVDMVRATAIIKVIRDEDLVANARHVGDHFRLGLHRMSGETISNVRGSGLMLAFDCKDNIARDRLVERLQENMLVLKSGTKSVRFRPPLTFSTQDADQATEFVRKALI